MIGFVDTNSFHVMAARLEAGGSSEIEQELSICFHAIQN